VGWYKNLSLRGKLLTGFLGMLLLLVLVAWAGWKGMGDIARRSELQNDMGRILRDAERGEVLTGIYVRSEEEKAASEVLRHLEGMKKELLAEREKLQDSEDLRQIAGVSAMVEAYERAFKAYVQAVEEAHQEEGVMVDAARKLLDASEKAVKSLADEVAHLMGRMEGAAQGTSREIASLAAVMEGALEELRECGIIIEQILQIRRSEKDYLLRGEARYIQELHDGAAAITTAAEMLRARVNANAAEHMAQLIENVEEYRKSFEDFVQSRLDFFDERGASLLDRSVEVLRSTPERLLPEQVRTLARTLGCRITVVDEDGTVLGDSEADPASMGNRGDRPEIAAAFEREEGQAERFSGTLENTVYYYARKIEVYGKPRIVRVAFTPVQANHVLAGSEEDQEIAWQRQLQQSMEEYAREAVASARELQEMIRSQINQELLDARGVTETFSQELVTRVQQGGKRMEAYGLFGGIIQEALHARRHEKNYILRKDQESLKAVHRSVERIQALASQFTGLLEGNRDAEEALKEIVQAAGTYGEGFTNFLGAYEEEMRLDSVMEGEARKMMASVEVLQQGQVAKALAEQRAAGVMLLGVAAFSVLLALFLAFYVTSLILRPVRQLRELMARAGGGDLSVRGDVLSRDDMGELTASFNLMIRSQAEMVRMVRKGVEELAASSEEIAASVEEVTNASTMIKDNIKDVADEADQGDSSVKEASKSLLELSSLVQIAKTSAEHAKENTLATRETADTGKKVVLEAVQIMQIVAQQVAGTEESIRELSNYTRQIVAITDTITSIADQTNLLALNAAIEAARAGEAGRGFAVVAEEVRKLAEESNRGAAEVAAIVQKVAASTGVASESMEKSRIEVEQGVATVNKGGEALQSITEAVEKTVTVVERILQVADEEVATSEAVVNMINQLATIIEVTRDGAHLVSSSSEETVACMETVAAGSEEISSMAQELDSGVGKFTVEDERNRQKTLQEILQGAKSDHLLWKMRIKNMLDGYQDVNPDEVASHLDCPLGVWYCGQGRDFAGDSLYEKLEEPHKGVHENARAAAQHYARGDVREARKAYRDLEKYSSRVIRILDGMIRKYRKKEPSSETGIRPVA